jgi:hypothetical protein
MSEQGKTTETSVLEKVQVDRRGFVKSLTIGTAFAVPFIASYSMDALRFSMAQAGEPSDTNNQSHGGFFHFIKHLIHKLFRFFHHDSPSP